MKKNLVMLLAAALFVVTGCKKDDNNAKKMTFTSDFGGGAKTEINDHSMKWTTGDDIIVNSETFACEVKEEGVRAEFTGKVVQSPYNAYYPTSIWNEGTPTLPSTQYYAENNLSRVSPMYANSETTSLDFHNICALVKLNLKGTGTVKTITASADQSLCGEFTIQENGTDGYYAAIIPTRDGAATVTLNCGDGVALTADAKAFYIALPQGEYDNLKFTVSNSDIAKVVTIAESNLVAGTLYAEEKEVELDAPVIPDGALSGKFTVNSSGKQVYFSKGNLQYRAVDGTAGNATATADLDNSVGGTWRFAEHQYETIGADNINKAQNYDGWVDLINWGCSGWNHGATCYQPWSTNRSSSSYKAYGNDNANLSDGNGKADWGYNKISNGGNVENSGWRTLSSDEWMVLVNRTTQDGKKLYGLGTVCEKIGLIILPDGWVCPEGLSFTYGATNYSSNIYSDNWNKMEKAGALFLPAAGYLGKTDITDPNIGYYWTSTAEKDYFYFQANATNPVDINDRLPYTGCLIRLVKDAN